MATDSGAVITLTLVVKVGVETVGVEVEEFTEIPSPVFELFTTVVTGDEMVDGGRIEEVEDDEASFEDKQEPEKKHVTD